MHANTKIPMSSLLSEHGTLLVDERLHQDDLHPEMIHLPPETFGEADDAKFRCWVRSEALHSGTP